MTSRAPQHPAQASTAAPSADALPHDPLVAAETLALLYRQSAPAMFFSLLVGALLVTGLWSAGNHTRLLLWCAAVLTIFVVRSGLFLAYFRARPLGAQVLRWRLPYVATLLTSAAIWGLGGLWIMPADSLPHQALTFAFLIGMAGSALTTYSAVRAIAMATFVVTVMPTVAWFLLHEDAIHRVMALGGLLFFVSSHRATRILAEALCRSIHLTHALERARRAAETAARTDSLTGLDNRRAFAERAGACVTDCRRRGTPVAALLIDIDHFKQVNDSCGHASGDHALAQLGRLLRESLPPPHCCGRLGGEEFGVLLADTSMDGAWDIAERLRTETAKLLVDSPDGQRPISISIGIADSGDDLETLLRAADAAMYRAKWQGRNCTARAQAPV